MIMACMVCGEIAQGVLALLLLCIPFIGGYIKRHRVHGDDGCDCDCHQKKGDKK
jgi:hypothetical protein